MQAQKIGNKRSGIIYKFLCASASLREFFVFLFIIGTGLRADVSMPPVFSDHMVLQQGVTLPIWGSASPGERISISFAKMNESTVADSSGNWRITLRPLPSMPAPLMMVINGKNRIEINDVITGDVWICAGEGNMAFPLSDASSGKEADDKVYDPKLRFFEEAEPANLTEGSSAASHKKIKGHWVVCTPESISSVSAVGYFFARDLRSTHHLPVGIIQCTRERTPIVSWISHMGLSKPPAIVTASKSHEGVNLKGEVGAPSSCFERLIQPLIPYAITGVIWYQGESDEGNAALQYRRTFQRLIRDWRSHWGEGPFPFYFVSLAGFGAEGGSAVECYHGADGSRSRGWPWIREGAASVLSLPGTGVAQATDLGVPDDRVPADKLNIGRRLALLARHRVYGEELVDEGPIYRGMKIEGDKVRVDFDSIGGGLVIGTPPEKAGDFSSSLVTSLKGFALSGSDHKWFSAQGRIEGKSVLLWSDAVPHPLAVRYNWKGFPNGSLYNLEGLPAAPFRSDSYQPE
jgi:sialate O-acetylesterase